MKRVFGIFELVFDVLYLTFALILGLVLFRTGAGNYPRILAGVMALVLFCGDAFHLLPRIMVIITQREKHLQRILGRGKQVTSITMTVFYLLLWQIGLLIFPIQNNNFWSYIVYILAAVRILLCLLPQNKWQERYPPINWGIWRNIPFFIG